MKAKLIFMGWSKNIFFEKQQQLKWPTKKTEFFNSTNSQYFFLKISGIGHWVSRIRWCKRQHALWLNLYGHQVACWPVESHHCPWHQFILLTWNFQEKILRIGVVEKFIFFWVGHFNWVFFPKKPFARSPWKSIRLSY